MVSHINFNTVSHSFQQHMGDDWGYEPIEDKDVIGKLAANASAYQVLFERSKKAIRLVRKYGMATIREASVAAQTVRLLEQDIRILDHYKKEKSNDPVKIGRVTVELRKIGRPELVKRLRAARRKLTKEHRTILDALKELEW